MPSGTAPGLGRFPLIFYKSWPELCPVLMSVVNSLLEEDKAEEDKAGNFVKCPMNNSPHDWLLIGQLVYCMDKLKIVAKTLRRLYCCKYTCKDGCSSLLQISLNPEPEIEGVFLQLPRDIDSTFNSNTKRTPPENSRSASLSLELYYTTCYIFHYFLTFYIPNN